MKYFSGLKEKIHAAYDESKHYFSNKEQEIAHINMLILKTVSVLSVILFVSYFFLTQWNLAQLIIRSNQ